MPLDYTAFRNRLRKMDRHHGKWARRRGLEAYRVYDADLDEFPITVDRYGDRLYVAIYGGDPEASPDTFLPHLEEALATDPGRIHFKLRQRQSGTAQYEKLDARQQEFSVGEYGRKFRINLTDYLDTGLFLDHRETRRMVGEVAENRSVLNLFAYTCSFGVYAATAGASRVDNLDLSNTYLDWGRRNFAENGLDPGRYGFLREDALQWLGRPVDRRYDLIVLDPPTFSNSKMMSDVLDTQRDHVMLVNRSLARLESDGTLYFSTNYRKFRIDESHIEGAVREITRQTLPPDFRKKNLHRCFTVTK